MFLSFVVPTWNRAKKMEVCVQSIAEQIRLVTSTFGINILVQDDCSDDETEEAVSNLQARYPGIIEYRCREKRTDYSDAFRDMFRASDAEWVWTFGDDDYLEPGALEAILKVIAHVPDLQYIHVSEKSRYSGTHGLYIADLLTLCNRFGWIDMTGFITGNICRSAWLHKAAASQHWKCYAKSAFVQSCALLEVLRDEKCALMDEPLVSLQSDDQTPETTQRWMADNIPTRYLYIAGALERMYDEGILTDKVKPAFFRYLSLHLWDRHLWYFIEDYLNLKGIWMDSAWSNVLMLAEFVDDENVANQIRKDTEAARGLTTLHNYMRANISGLETEMRQIQGRHAESAYPNGYILPKEMLK